MTVSYLRYPLLEGFVHNWLVAGPQIIPVHITGEDAIHESRARIAAENYVPELEIDALPVERGKLTDGVFAIGDYQGSWNYYNCKEDHLVNHSGVYAGAVYLRSWAYCQLVCSQEMDVQFRLAAPGPMDIWLNHKRLLRNDAFDDRLASHGMISARLAKGANKLAVRFENLGSAGCAHYMALQVCDSQGAPLPTIASIGEDAPLVVQIPTLIMPRLIELRNRLEKLYAGMRLERDVFERDQDIALLFPDDEVASEVVTVRLKTPANLILADGVVEGKPGLRRKINSAFELYGGRYQVELLPRVWEYYEHDMRIKKEISLWTVGNAPYSTAPYGTFPERAREGLLKAVEQRNNLFAEMAKMALGWWRRVEPEVILDGVARVERRETGCVLDLAALLGILGRFSTCPEFPTQLLQPIQDCALGYDYSLSGSFDAEWAAGFGSGAILTSACESLAGQRFADRVFSSDRQAGHWHFERGSQRAFAWLHERGLAGFPGWGSSEELSGCLVALALLVDLLDAGPLQEMATVGMDKIFFTLSLNGFQGILGSAQRAVSPNDLKGGILQPTCPVSRLMWGMGVFNHRIEALVSLACIENYQLPPMIAEIANDPGAEVWNREQHLSGAGVDSHSPVNKVSYRTPAYLLASAQDYRPGQSAAQELVWQATLGPSATVFVNHPGCSFTEAGMFPGYWVGNTSLPRVAQWKGSLVAIYDLPEKDWMGFTHAYFPTPAFDEYVLRGGWAFARKREGYLALTASTGISLVTYGEYAFHELRSPGKQVIWICHMGQAALDGDFTSFQDKVLSLPLRHEGLWVAFDTPQGDRLSFGSSQPFLLNGEEVALDNFPHYENRYSITSLNSSQMDIVFGESVLRLDFTGTSDIGIVDPAQE